MVKKNTPEELKNTLSEMQFYVTQNMAQNRRLPGVYCTISAMGFIIVWCAMRRFSTPKVSMTPDAAGPVFMSR